MTEKCPNCGAPAGKAHVCRYRFKEPSAKRTAGEKIIKGLQDALEIAKGEREPARVTIIKVPKLPSSHPDCGRCKAYRKQQRDTMRLRRAKP